MALRELFAKFEFEWDQGTLQKVTLATQGAEQKVQALAQGINQQAAAVRAATTPMQQYGVVNEQGALAASTLLQLHTQLTKRLDQMIGALTGATNAEAKFSAGSGAAGAGLKQITAGTAEAAAGTSKLSNVMHQALAAFGIFGGVFGAVFAGHALKETIHGELEAADAALKMAQQLGIGTEALQQMSVFAKVGGVDLETFRGGIVTMNRNVGLFASGAPNKIGKIFKIMKLGVKDLKGEKPEDLFWQFGQAIAAIEDPAQKAAFAEKIFGEAGVRMLTLFKGTAPELEKQKRLFSELGAVYSEDFAENAERVNDELELVGVQFARIKASLVANLIPMLSWASSKLTQFGAAIANAGKRTNALQGAFIAGGWMVFAKVLARLTAGGGGIVKWLAKLWPMLLSIGRVLVPWLAWALILDDIITFLQGGDSALGRFIDSMFGAGAAGEVLQKLKDGWQAVQEKIAEVGPVVKQFFTDYREEIKAGAEAIGILTLATMTGLGKIIAQLVVAIASWGFHTAAIWASNVAGQSLWLTLLDIGIALGAFALAAASIYAMVDQFVKLKNEVGGVANIFKGLLSMFKGKGFFAGVDEGMNEQARAEAAARGAAARDETPAALRQPMLPLRAPSADVPPYLARPTAGSAATVTDNRAVTVNVTAPEMLRPEVVGRKVAGAISKAQPPLNLNAAHGALVGAPNG
jgi:hypothetical protein